MSQSARDLALNRWPALLAHFGIEHGHLTGKHAPCPSCGGKDRFRFDDKEGRGTWFCSKCGSGDGFALLGLVKGWSFRDAANEVECIAGNFQPGKVQAEQSTVDKLDACRRIWSESMPVCANDPVALYLLHRTGIENVPACIRFHTNLTYRHDDGSITRHPAMIAKVQDGSGAGVALHRTYLTLDGQKAAVSTPKKVLGSLSHYSAIRLSQHSGRLGIAEGVETALAASLIFQTPTWAAISANGLERWMPPVGIGRMLIFGDNDVSHTGQAAAYALAKRLTAAGISTEVRIPERPGTDWADYSLDFSTKKEQQHD